MATLQRRGATRPVPIQNRSNGALSYRHSLLQSENSFVMRDFPSCLHQALVCLEQLIEGDSAPQKSNTTITGGSDINSSASANNLGGVESADDGGDGDVLATLGRMQIELIMHRDDDSIRRNQDIIAQCLSLIIQSLFELKRLDEALRVFPTFYESHLIPSPPMEILYVHVQLLVHARQFDHADAVLSNFKEDYPTENLNPLFAFLAESRNKPVENDITTDNDDEDGEIGSASALAAIQDQNVESLEHDDFSTFQSSRFASIYSDVPSSTTSTLANSSHTANLTPSSAQTDRKSLNRKKANSHKSSSSAKWVRLFRFLQTHFRQFWWIDSVILVSIALLFFSVPPETKRTIWQGVYDILSMAFSSVGL